MIILAVLFVLILLVAIILVTNKNLSEYLTATLIFVLALFLVPVLIVLFMSRIGTGQG